MNVRLMVLVIFALFVLPLVFVRSVSAEPLESFAENPIPYWDDDSSDVDVIWDSVEQTVTVEYDSYAGGYYEDMSMVTDWIPYPPDTITTDGDIASVEFASGDDWNQAYTNAIALDVSSDTWYFEIRYKANVTIRDMFIRCYEADDIGGALLEHFVITDPITSWNVYKEVLTTLVQIESILISGESLGNANFQVDYIRIWPEYLYEEDMSVVTDWTLFDNEGADSFTTDGDIATFVCEYDGVGDDFDFVYSDVPAVTYMDYYVTIRFKFNATPADFRMYLYDEDVMAGDYRIHYFWESTDWITMTQHVSEAGLVSGTPTDIDCISLLVKTTEVGDIELEIDYIRIWALGDLDISVPLLQQSIQSIELMGNFSALDSTVRFQMYDSGSGAGLWCDVNSTQVTFPDAAYAEFTNIARINFSLNEEIRIFTIYVYEQDTTLIDYYSVYDGLANKDYLRMTDAAFNGSYQLLYLQGDLGYLAEVIDTENIFYQLFLSLEMWGYLGPVALVVLGYVLAKKDRSLGVIAFVVQCLFAAQYFALLEATPAYWWHVIIILLGGILACVVPLMDR